MNLYRIDLNVLASVYIKADSPGDALAEARELEGSELSKLRLVTRPFDNPRLPAISTSLTLTILNVFGDGNVELACANVPAPSRAPANER